jgi:hypothetical protein
LIDDTYIYAGVSYTGLWKRPLSDIFGTSGIQKRNFTIGAYPNPCDGLLNIEINQTSGNDDHLEIYNLWGKKVFETRVVPGINTIDLTANPQGMYIVVVNQGDKVSVQKVIKN